MSKSPREEPEWQWLEDGLVGLVGFACALIAGCVTILVNLVCLVVGYDPGKGNDK